MPHFPDFYNQWTIQSLGVVPVDAGNNRFMEKAETSIFGFEPFNDVANPDLTTATDRPIYGALNFYRDSAANLQCGPVCVCSLFDHSLLTVASSFTFATFCLTCLTLPSFLGTDRRCAEQGLYRRERPGLSR